LAESGVSVGIGGTLVTNRVYESEVTTFDDLSGKRIESSGKCNNGCLCLFCWQDISILEGLAWQDSAWHVWDYDLASLDESKQFEFNHRRIAAFLSPLISLQSRVVRFVVAEFQAMQGRLRNGPTSE
jgi:hypothetical protein